MSLNKGSYVSTLKLNLRIRVDTRISDSLIGYFKIISNSSIDV